MDYIRRLERRRALLKSAYTAEDSKPEHRDEAMVLVNVLVDISLAARVAGRDLSGLIADAERIADREWYFAGSLLGSQGSPSGNGAVDEEAPEPESAE